MALKKKPQSLDSIEIQMSKVIDRLNAAKKFLPDLPDDEDVQNAWRWFVLRQDEQLKRLSTALMAHDDVKSMFHDENNTNQNGNS